MVRQIDRSGTHIGISPLSMKKTKYANKNAIRHHLLDCKKIRSFEKFSILTHGSKKCLLKLKESL